MFDPRVRKLAELLVNYSVAVKKEDWVHIDADKASIPLAKEVLKAAVKAGARVSYEIRDPEFSEIFLKNADDSQISWVNPIALRTIKDVDVAIFINAPENTRLFNGIDPAKQQLRQKSYREWHEIYMKRSANGSLRWTLTNYPTAALAQDADMSLSDYEDFVYSSTFVDKDDPIAEWEKIRIQQEHLVQWLEGKNQIAIKGENVDLVMKLEGRKFLNSWGDQNMPSGEIFTSPVENSANGWVKFTYPAIYNGREVEGIRLEFENGKVISARAEKNEDFLLKMLSTDEGSSYLGELGIGTNYGITRFTRDILYDEKIGGTFHLAVGSGFEEVGGKNVSAVHWDLICDARKDTEMTADGIRFYRNGKFII